VLGLVRPTTASTASPMLAAKVAAVLDTERSGNVTSCRSGSPTVEGVGCRRSDGMIASGPPE
jgi:hypothetical protein